MGLSNAVLNGAQKAAGASQVAGLTAAGDLVRQDGYGVSNNRAGCAFDVNYAAWPGLLIDSLSSLTGWSLVQTNGTITTDTLSNGLPGVKFTTTGGVPNLLMTKDFGSSPIRYDQSTNFGMWLEVSDPGILASVQVLFSNEAGGVFTNWRYYQFGGSGGAVFKNIYFVTVNTASSVLGGNTPNLAGEWKSCRIRVTTGYPSSAPKPGWIKISKLMAAPLARTKVCVDFDDGYASQYYDCFRYLSKYGLAGNIGVTADLVGDPNYVTMEQLQSMYAAGWGICPHGNTHIGMNGTSHPTKTNDICLVQTPGTVGPLTLNGSLGSGAFDAPCHVVVRASSQQGAGITIVGLDVNNAPLTEVINTTISIPVPAPSLFSKVNSITIDMVPTGTITIGRSQSVQEMSDQITISHNLLKNNGMVRGAYDYIYPNGEFNNSSTALMASLGMRSARIVQGQNQAPQVGDFRKYEMQGYGGGGAALTGAAMLAKVDEAIGEGRNITIYLHEIIQGVVNSVGTQTVVPTNTQTLMQELIIFADGLSQRALAGKCDVVTRSMLPVA